MIQHDTNRFAIVTGVGFGGVGYYTALKLASAPYNYTVTLACRNTQTTIQVIEDFVQRGVDAKRLFQEQVDVSSIQSVRRFADRYVARGIPLHLLVCNAGTYNAPVSEDGLNGTIATNHVGHFYLIQLMSELLVASSPARVINVVSRAHADGQFNWNNSFFHPSSHSYADAKLYQLCTGREWHRRFRLKGVSVYNVHPGDVSTHFLETIMSGFLLRLVKSITSLFFLTPEQGSITTISAVDEQPANLEGEAIYLVPVKKKGGSYCAITAEVNKSARDSRHDAELFEFTERIIADKRSRS